MKKQLFFIALLCVLVALFATACGEDPTVSPTPPTIDETPETVIVAAVSPTVEIRDREVAAYDFTTLFTITENGQPVTVKPEYLILAGIDATPGSYPIICQYGGQTATVTAEVFASRYFVTAAQKTVTVKLSEATDYDYKALFTIVDDAATPVTLTDEMITTDFTAAVGSYTYRVTCVDDYKEITITVIPDHEVEIMTTYRAPALTCDEVIGYDMTELFSLYVDGVPVKVTLDMLDTSALPTDAASVNIGDTYTITLTYTTADGLTTGSQSTTITVVSPVATVLTGRDTDIYINARPLDLATLFTIRYGEKEIPVTAGMITGEVDYTAAGDYTITLTYEGETATAVVHVKDGVVLGYTKSDVVQVKQGTDPLSYPFTEDFSVVINGVRFDDFSRFHLDISSVDFTTAGSYTATLTIPYNDVVQTGLRPPTPVDYTISITYLVVKNDYKITVLEEALELPKGTTAYDVFKNLHVEINGKWQTLTTNPDWVNFVTCYAEVLSAPVDFTTSAEQEVRIAVYVNGPDAPYVEAVYTLCVESGITISAGNTAIFSGSSLYVKDLFTIREGHTEIPVTADMISGKVDVFTPGSYEVSITYMGMTETAQVVVLDHRLLGNYFTPMTTIPYYESSDNDEEEDVLVSGKRISDLVIGEDGSISFALVKDGVIKAGTDANTLQVQSGINTYTLHYMNGIIVLDSENDLGLSFNDYKRPLVYFNADMYSIENVVTVGYSDSYVLMEGAYTGNYSIDTFRVVPKDGGEAFWFGLYVKLIEKMSSDTFYDVKWGSASYPEDFSPRNGVSSTLTFNGTDYPFTMWNGSNGKVETASTGNPWKNTVFKGTLDGVATELRCDRYGHVTLVKGGSIIAYVNISVSYGSFAEFDEKNKTLKLYAIDDREGYGTYSYLFTLNTDDNTFTNMERDRYFGKYVYGDYYFFFDGFGRGRVRFDPTSYATTPFTYGVNGSLVTVEYLDVKPKFAYGTGAEFYMAPLLNVLTVRSFTGAELVGQDFVNEIITDGAIITIGSSVMVETTKNLGREALLAQISIITKDGVMSAETLKDHVTTGAINFAAAGFYRYTIQLTVGGEEVVTKYTIEILPKTYEGNPLAVSWHAGLLGETSLTLDAAGQVTLKLGAEMYTGLAVITDTGFSANVYNAARQRVSLTGSLLTDGIMTVTGTGSVNFSDTYTIGATRIIGTTGVILREIICGGVTRYYLSESTRILGNEVTVSTLGGESLSAAGAVLVIEGAGEPLYVRVAAWGNTTSGLTSADAYRGSYTTEEGDTLVIDGFGTAALGAMTGSYRITDKGILTVTYSTTDVRLYRLDTTAFTYQVLKTASGEALVAGSTYSGSYLFVCGNYSYTAETSFVFRDGGVVIVRSTSAEHDSGEDFCYDDTYAPSFASAEGVEGSYTVTADRVTVTVNGETFVFHISNLLEAGELVCESTTVASDAHGQFDEGTAFRRDA